MAFESTMNEEVGILSSTRIFQPAISVLGEHSNFDVLFFGKSTAPGELFEGSGLRSPANHRGVVTLKHPKNSEPQIAKLNWYRSFHQ